MIKISQSAREKLESYRAKMIFELARGRKFRGEQ